MDADSRNVSASGCFTWEVSTHWNVSGAEWEIGTKRFNFNASRSSSVYSDDATTVTVDSLKVAFYIRY